MKKCYLIIIIVLIVLTGCSQGLPTQTKDKTEHVNINIYHGGASLLFYIAQREGYFADNGLEIKLTPFPTGRDALNDTIAGNADYSVVADFAMLKKRMEYSGFKIVASVSAADINSRYSNISSGIYAKKSSGILRPSDLKGKKVAVLLNTVAEFICGVFLEKNGMSFSDVEMVDIRTSDRKNFLKSDAYDAFFAWESRWYEMFKANENDIVFFPMPSALPFHILLLEQTVNKKSSPEATENILRALIQADKWHKANPEGTLKLSMELFSQTEEAARNAMNRHNHGINFPYTLPKALEAQKRWLARYKSAESLEKLSIWELFDTGPLMKVAPETVTIIE